MPANFVNAWAGLFKVAISRDCPAPSVFPLTIKTDFVNFRKFSKILAILLLQYMSIFMEKTKFWLTAVRDGASMDFARKPPETAKYL